MNPSSPIQITHIPLEDIQPSPLNPRKHFDEAAITELAASIIVQGVLQPILVRLIRPGKYEIVAGERRYRASLRTQLHDTIPCIIRDLTEEQALDIMIVENLQRKDIHPMEEANGFKQIMDIKHIDIKEMAARVGKSRSFVAQRLKLCDLIEPIQQHFFNGWLMVKDALRLSQLKPADQQDFYDMDMSDRDELIEVSDWDLRRYQNRLEDATFDINDPALIPGTPACVSCPYNSASALLFAEPDQAAICNDSSCYRAKCDRAYHVNLVAAVDAPDVVLITGQRWAGDKVDKDVKAMIDAGTDILHGRDYTEIDIPDEPDYYDFGDDEEDQQNRVEAMQQYLADKAAYEKAIKSKKYIKAFITGGDRKGQYTYVKVDSASTDQDDIPDEDAEPVEVTPDSLRDQIDYIQRKGLRDIAAARDSRWDEIMQKFADPVQYVNARHNEKVSFDELQAVALAIFNSIDADYESAFKDMFYASQDRHVIPEGYMKSPHILADLLRFFFMASIWPRYFGSEHADREAAMLETCLSATYEKGIEDIDMRHKAIADEIEATTAQQIKELEAKLKALETKKPAAKKGKGIKALIPAIFLLFLFGCSPDDTIPVPVCTMVTTRQDGDRLSIEIHSASPSIEMCREWGRCYTIPAHYYGCVSTTVESDEIITFVDGTEECQVITAHQP